MPIGFIFFDMDETLGFFRNYDGSMNDEGFPSGIFLRRYIKDILDDLNKDFVLFITTAATLNYTKAVLQHSGLTKYFHGIFTRNDFVKLENATDANKEASPGGYEKRYGLIMKHFGIRTADAKFGIVIGDNDYDVSCDVEGLRTLIIDSLFIPADILKTVIRDIFDNKDVTKNYSDLGLKVSQKKQLHPIAKLESDIFEIDCPDHLMAVELEKVDVNLTESQKAQMKVHAEEKSLTKKIAENKANDNLANAKQADEKISEVIKEREEKTD